MYVILSAALALTAASLAAQAPPSTDIYLVPLGPHLKLGAPTNVTNRPGYDNQPSFTPDGRAILFTSTHDDGQSDIYRYDLRAKTVSRVTSTPESEYSATVMPGGKRFSAIRVEKDSTQRLWSFALDGRDPKVVVETLKPVGYHAWLDKSRLVMFVLGRPNALVAGDLETGKLDTLARDIGRSLARIPGGSGFSYVQLGDSTARLRGMNLAAKRTWDIAPLPRGVQDIVWLANGTVLAGSGEKLLAWKKGASVWAEIADLAAGGVTQITRLAVSPDGKWLAIVAVPKG